TRASCHQLRRLAGTAHRTEPEQDREKLVNAVSAGVARGNGFETARRERLGKVRLIQDPPQPGFHLRAVGRHEEVAARPEQALDVLPLRADQRDTAGERLEYSDGRYAEQPLAIG